MESNDFKSFEGSGREMDLYVGRIAAAMEQFSSQLERIADHMCPPSDALVDSRYVAGKLGVSIERISQMARSGEIPCSCVVEGSGNGKPWKFHRRSTDSWILNR